MDIARINCAHDDQAAWRAMSDNVRAVSEQFGYPIRVLMDIAGPKIRTGTVAASERRIVTGDRFRLVAADPVPTPEVPFAASLAPPQIVARLRLGETALYNDGKLEAVVEELADGAATLRVVRTRAGGVRLKPEKGINLPGTALGLSPLTSKDEADIATLIDCADLVGYSFVSEPADIDILEELLDARGGKPSLGLVAKIERPERSATSPS